MTQADENVADIQLVEKAGAAQKKILTEVRKVIIGQAGLIEEVLIALFAGGHCLLVGVPGLAKTLLVSTIANAGEVSVDGLQANSVHPGHDAF